MIPVYPNSKKLELSDRADVERITKKFLPYSDFNFTSMWSWNVHNKMSISKLNGNLVVRFTDYQTGKPFYSFLGNNDPSGTARALINLSKKQGLEPRLRLIPKDSIDGIDSSFIVQDDRDNFDYIFDLSKLESYKGNDFETHRRLCNRFMHSHPNVSTKALNLEDSIIQNSILNLMNKWEKNKIDHGKEARLNFELAAIKRLFSVNTKNLVSIGIFINEIMIAFCTNELLYSGWAISHFAKGNLSYKDVYSYLMQQNAKFLLKEQRHLLNYEQDLGVSVLRYSKNSFRPLYLLTKHT